MLSNESNGSCSLLARGFATLRAVLAMGLGLMASSAEAGPFAYVVGSNLSVIDTATNAVVATVPVGGNSVAVTSDGKRAYVSDGSVIDTATNKVVAKAPVGNFPYGVAVAPDGKRAYYTITNFNDLNAVRVVNTATNRVMATISIDLIPPNGIAIAPDGKSAYVVSSRVDFIPAGIIVVIDTATNKVVSTNFLPDRSLSLFGVAIAPDGKAGYATGDPVPEGLFSAVLSFGIIPSGGFGGVDLGCVCGPRGIAVTPDGKLVYVANSNSNDVSVADTASATVVATVPVGSRPLGVAITPDGNRAYVTNFDSNDVSVIETATNTVVATVAVGDNPVGVGIMPPPRTVPFLAFNAKLQIHIGHARKKDAFNLQSSFTLSSAASNGINPVTDPVTLQVGTFTVKIPPGSFRKHGDGLFTSHGVVDGVRLEALIRPTGTLRYAFHAEAHGADLTGTKNPVPIILTIDDDSGTTSVKATNFVAALE